MNLPSLISTILVVGLGTVVLSAGTDGFNAFTSETARRLEVLRDPRPVPPTVLEDQSGRQFQLNETNGQWLLIEFIYTRCPDVCYAMGSAFQQLQHLLKEKKLDHKVHLLSISFDPEYDQRTMLMAYAGRVQANSQNWSVTRPVQTAQLQGLLAQFGVTVIADVRGGYQHNAAIHLVDDKGRLVEIFDYQTPDLVADELWTRLTPTTI